MKKIFLLAFFSIFIITIHAQEIPTGFYSYKLENGLELYVQEDFTIPTMKIEYISKAGTSRQTQNTTGMFQLYSRLFWQNNYNGKDMLENLGAAEFSSQVSFSQSQYSFEIPASNFLQVIEAFSKNLQNVQFLDEAIQREFYSLKQEVSAWQASVPGFINSAIDAKVFSKAPWTKDSGIYPALFSDNTVEELRQKLSVITNRWYVPEQSALFISGPLSAQIVLENVQNNFSAWQSSNIIGSISDAQNAKTTVEDPPLSENKLYALVSDDFTKDYVQAVLQYPSGGLGASENYSANAWTAAEAMQSKLLESGMTNTNTSFVADASDSRIIIQSLFDATNINDTTNLSLMIPGFSNIVKSTALTMDDADIMAAKQRILLYRNDSFANSTQFMNDIAENWAYGGVEFFLDFPQTIQNVELKDVKQSFNDPWVFVLLHTSLYEKNKDSFTHMGYSAITNETNMWYSQNNTTPTVSQEQMPIIPDSMLYNYTEYTKSLLETTTLTSNIPIVTQKIPNTPWVSLLLTIEGGDVIHGASKRGTEHIAIQNLKNTLEENLSKQYYNNSIKTIPVLENDTDIYSSYINIVCLSEDLEIVLQTLSKTIIESSILISAADELFLSTAYNWRLESGSLEYQLYAAAMETLYGGTPAQGLFNANTELLTHVEYSDIKRATELLYDSQRLSFVLAGSIPDNVQENFEKYFGIDMYPIEKQFRATLIDEQVAVFSPFEQIVRLRHTFLTDVPANLAGERPTKLIPTTDFSDPAQLYFEIPSFTDMEQSIFVSLLYEIAERLTEEFSKHNTPPAQSVSVVPGMGVQPVSCLRFSKVKSRENLKRMVENTFNDLINDLENEKTNVMPIIKSRYIRILSKEMETLRDRTFVIQQGIRTSNNPSLYLEKINSVENAPSEDFLTIFKYYLTEGEFFWLFSADTAK